MAIARMLHNKISRSLQVGRLPIGAQLLFTWTFSHADSDGRLLGEPQYIKITVVPQIKWSHKVIKNYLELMDKEGLIHYWNSNNEWYIEFINWKKYQHIRKSRYIPSDLPSFIPYKDVHTSDIGQTAERQVTPKYSAVKSSSVQVNKGEYGNGIANKKAVKQIGDLLDFERLPEPIKYVPTNQLDTAAKDACMKLEPNNKRAFYTTYLRAAKMGLPADCFYSFVSEIKQSNCDKPGAVFNTKVKDYFDKKASTIGQQSSKLSS